MLEILKKYGNIFTERLKKNHLDAGQKASGNAYAEFGFTAKENSLVVFGADYVDSLEVGRKSGTAPQQDVIYDWSISKGINFETESKRRSFAFLVARKIAESGTLLHRTGKTFSGFEKPISSVFDDKILDEMTKEIAEKFMKNEMLEINKIFEKWQSK